MSRKAMPKTNRPVRRRITFQAIAAPGSSVFVAGSFNNWQPIKELTDKNNDGVYVGILMLDPGTYESKLVVNGEWRIDENNPNFVPNELGTLNSVIVVEPF